jgi:flavin reductase (DIM6/NTAB) family NADH-FMN oxidoreductase RutF
MTTDPIKEALQRLPYGFYSITSRNGDEVNAMVGNWLTQASFEPRLIVFGLAKKAYSHEVIRKAASLPSTSSTKKIRKR